METFVNFFVWSCSIAIIVVPLCISDYYPFIAGGVALFIFYPILQEFILFLYQKVQRSLGKIEQDMQRIQKAGSSSHYIVYNSSYNLTACGLEKLHPFDSTKYRRIHEYLTDWRVIESDTKIMSPSVCPRMYLYEMGSFKHLMLLNYSLYVAKCIELPIFILPAWLLRWRVLNPMLGATYGTIHAAIKAMETGYSINLSGGYHHASGNSGGGFGIYPDISIAIKVVRKLFHISKVMIIDLDAHQGNGHERDFLNDDNTFIIDCYCPDIYPGDRVAKKAIKEKIYVYPSDDDNDYIQNLLPIYEGIDTFKPEFILYNAGTDIMKGDPLSSLNITENGVIARDELVFQCAINKNIPICMVLSGGYQRANAHGIAKSIQNIDMWIKSRNEGK